MNYFSSRCIQPDEWSNLSPFFRPTEFHYPENMGMEFIVWLNQLRRLVNLPIVLTSDYRPAEYNTMIGGAPDSAHCDIPCNAVDIGERPTSLDPNFTHTRFRIVQCALQLGCVRIGLYSNGSLHLDRTEQHRAAEVIWRQVGSLKP